MRCLLICALFCIALHASAQKFDKDYQVIATLFTGNETDLRLAMDICDRILAEDSTEVLASEYKAYIYGRQKKYKASAETFAKLAVQFPDNSSFPGNAGWYYMLAGEYQKAFDHCRRSLDIRPDQLSGTLNLGHACLKLKLGRQAEHWYGLAAEMITSRDILMNAPIADFQLLDSLEPSPVYAILEERFITRFEKVEGYRSNHILDSIFDTEDPETLIHLKKRFIEVQEKEPNKRDALLLSYYFEVGRAELRANNITRAVEKYTSKAAQLANHLQDSMALFSVFYYLSRDLLVVKQMADKTQMNDDALYFAQMAIHIADSCDLDPEHKLMSNYQAGEAATAMEWYDTALLYYKRAIQYYQLEMGYQAENSLLTRVLQTYNELTQYDSLDAVYQKIIANFQQNRDRKGEYVTAKSNYITIVYNRFQFRQAINLANEFIREFGKRNQHQVLAEVYSIAGRSLYKLHLMDSAITYLETSLDQYQRYSDRFQELNPGRIAKFAANEMLLSFVTLKKIYIERNDAVKVFELTEKSKENLLHYLVSGENQVRKPVTLQELQSMLRDDEACIVYTNGNDQDESLSIGISNRSAAIQKHSISFYTDLISSLSNLGLATLLTKAQQVRLQKQPLFLGTMLPMIYYQQMVGDPANTRGLGKKNSADVKVFSPEAKKTVGQILFRQFVKPHESLLHGKKKLYIIADMQLNYCPIETFLDEDGMYLGEKFEIVYIPSATIAREMKEREYSNNGKILAFGNPDYSSYDPKKLEGRAYDYAALIPKWSDLEGTSKEMEMLKGLGDHVTTITGAAVSETAFKKMDMEDQLAGPEIIHFALHGFTNVTVGIEDNSLILTEPPTGTEDGFLQFFEISNLLIRARLVCLSACETSLGVPAEDGSNVSVTSAFLAAGAGSCIGSVWKVSDEATTIFMKDFYTHLRNGKSHAEALHLTRLGFIRGKRGDRYRSPFFWAPFKYYGAF